MIEKRTIWVIAFFLILSLAANGQVTKKDLIGEWIVDNNDSLYFKADTIELYQDANFRFGLKTCNWIEWRIDKNSFRLVDIYTCSEPGRENYSIQKEKLRIRNRGDLQVLEIIKRETIVDSFQILDLQEREVNRYPWNVKVLKLKRI